MGVVEFSKFSQKGGGELQIFSIKRERLVNIRGSFQKKEGITYFHTANSF